MYSQAAFCTFVAGEQARLCVLEGSQLQALGLDGEHDIVQLHAAFSRLFPLPKGVLLAVRISTSSGSSYVCDDTKPCCL